MRDCTVWEVQGDSTALNWELRGRGRPVLLAVPTWSRPSIMMSWEQGRRTWVVAQMPQTLAILIEV